MKIFFASLVTLGFLDFIWLGLIVKRFTTEQLRPIAILSADGELAPNKLPALLAYLVMAFAFTVFVGPKLSDESLLTTVGFGAALGVSIYGIFDLTNYAIVRNYPLPFALVDTAWGTTAYALTALILWNVRSFLI